jgi:hypothetical protein
MNTAVTEDTVEEKPLDPEMEKVRRKMVRLLVVSIGIMMAGLMAVLFALVYKTASGGSTPAEGQPAFSTPAKGTVLTGRIPLPAGAQIRSHSLSANRIALRVVLKDGGEKIFLYDLAAGRMVGDFDVSAE